MSRWLSGMPFRTQLTLWWALAFGLLLAVANLTIYGSFNVYLRRDLDRKVRTVAATELASSTDGAGNGFFALPVSSDPAYVGLAINAQWIVVDPNGEWQGLVSLSEAIHYVVGQ